MVAAPAGPGQSARPDRPFTPLCRLEFGIERDRGVKHAGNGTIGLRVGGNLLELLTPDSWDARARVEVNAGNCPVALDLFQREGCLRREFLGSEARAAEKRGERHRKAPGVSGGDELLGIR